MLASHATVWCGSNSYILGNNTRFLLLPDKIVPNLGSIVLSRVAARLSDDWMENSSHLTPCTAVSSPPASSFSRA